MSVEPHEVKSVSTPRIDRCQQDKPRDPADYLAYIARRFPDCIGPTGAADPVALARREVFACLGKFDRQRPGTLTNEGLIRIAEAARAKGEVTMLKVVSAISGTMTKADVARAANLPESTVGHALQRALNAKLIVKGRLKNMTDWDLRQEAAE